MIAIGWNMKLRNLILTITALLCFGAKASAADQLYYLDTLKNLSEQKMIRLAIKEAPTAFVYKTISWSDLSDGYKCVSMTGIKFNDSMKALIKSGAISEDPRMNKKIKRIWNIVRPLGVTLDLTLDWKEEPKYIIARYHINNIKVWGHKASTKEIDLVK